MNNKRIPDNLLPANFVDGQIYQHTDVNKLIDVLKNGINANYDDIQDITSGQQEIGNAATLNGLTATTSLDGELSNDDTKLPTEKKVKNYVDTEIADVKPVRGVDYWTETDKQEIKEDVYNSVVTDSTSAFNQNAAEKTAEFNSNATSKTTTFNTNVESKTGTFNDNASDKTDNFNNNYNDKITDFDENYDNKILAFNSNATEKTAEFDNNASTKTTAFNSNATSKTSDFNTNATEKTAEFDQDVEEAKAEIEVMMDAIPTGGTTGQVLKKKSNDDYDTEWSNDGSSVSSVNGKTGEVVLNATDIKLTTNQATIEANIIRIDETLDEKADADSIPTKTSDLTNDSGFINSVKTINNETITGTGNINTKDVSISQTQPTNGEKIWVKPSVNLCDIGNEFSFNTGNEGWYFIDGIRGATGTDVGTKTNKKLKIENGKTYTFSFTSNQNILRFQLISENEIIIINSDYNISSGNKIFTFVSNYTGYIIPRFNLGNSVSISITNIQLEEGSIAHTYEPYNESKKEYYNNNGTYEKLSDTVSVGSNSNKSGLWIECSKNLFNKDNYTSLLAHISGSTITSNDGNLVIMIECKPNTTYTIKKLSSIRLRCGYSTSKAVLGSYNSTYKSYVLSSSVTLNSNAVGELTNYDTTISITTDAIAKYLYIEYYVLDDVINYTNIIDSLMVEEGDVSHNYEPYITPSIKANINGNYEKIYSKPVVLWTNPSPTSDFASQTITLNDNVSTYEYYEIMYKPTSASDAMLNTGKIFSNYKAYLSYIAQVNYRRTISAIGGTSIVFNDTQFFNSYNNSTTTTANNFLIPYQVIGYNKKDNVSQQTPALSMTPPSNIEQGGE